MSPFLASILLITFLLRIQGFHGQCSNERFIVSAKYEDKVFLHPWKTDERLGDWYHNEGYCATHCAEMVTIGSSRENNFFHEFMRNAGMVHPGAWLGAQIEDKNDIRRWKNGKQVVYSPKAPGEYNEPGLTCLSVGWENNQKWWRNYYCTGALSSRFFIACQRNISAAIPTQPPTTTNSRKLAYPEGLLRRVSRIPTTTTTIGIGRRTEVATTLPPAPSTKIPCLPVPSTDVLKIIGALKCAVIPIDALTAAKNNVFQYEIKDEDGDQITYLHFDFKNSPGKIDIGEYTDEEPDVTFKINEENFVKLLTEEISGIWAVMTGKLVIVGNLATASAFEAAMAVIAGDNEKVDLLNSPCYC